MSTTEKHHFQAEIQQLLDIVIHSLYTDKEIFVRELISNAADACEKLRFLQSSGTEIHQPEVAPEIHIQTDDKLGLITISDSGIGMTHADLVQNLGTIAHSGTKAFLSQLAEQNKKADAQLIGKFGVGFYSAFMAAGKVSVHSRAYLPQEQGWVWTSEGANGYEIEQAQDLPRGTRIVLTLKDDAKAFSEESKLEGIIKRYSNFVQFPIHLNGKRINTVQAIWSRSQSEVKEEEYNEFYQYLGHDQDKPLYRLHFNSDAPLSIQSLLFVPAKNWESMGMGRIDSDVHLYCRKVLIQSKAKDLFPEWLRFLKGVVDSEDLPLNISRESMQDSTLMQRLNKALTGKFIKFLGEQAEKDAAAYETFYAEYQRFIKEGVATDYTHREGLGKLLRYETSTTKKGELTSLSAYVTRMGAEQKEIYYLLAPNREAAEASPYYEVFLSRGTEVVFMYDPWDEFVMEHLHTFEGKTLKAAEKADLGLEKTEGESLSEADGAALAKWMKETLGEAVREVRISQRLVESPAVLVDSDKYMTSSMRRILKAAGKGQEGSGNAPQDLEINPRSPIIIRLSAQRGADAALAGTVTEQLLDNARVSAGLLEDPRAMLKRMNELLERVLGKQA
ncbi:MAG: molecular chaperone HtpG [Verrucomicrobia bacterium]|nr:molecular chaperone HtpG [Verrucomicrobiota bacterium]